METGSSVDFLRLTTAWYSTILSCCLYGVSHISSPIMGFLNLLKNLNEFTKVLLVFCGFQKVSFKLPMVLKTDFERRNDAC